MVESFDILNGKSLKYLGSTNFGCKEIEIRKSEFRTESHSFDVKRFRSAKDGNQELRRG